MAAAKPHVDDDHEDAHNGDVDARILMLNMITAKGDTGACDTWDSLW